MNISDYLNLLSTFGIGGAHPGGIDLTKEMLKLQKINSDTTILDVGCGTGQTAAYLAKTYGAKVTAIDINPLMIEKAKQRISVAQLHVNILQGSIEKTTLQENSFDLILSESVLSFVKTTVALNEIYRLLKSGGRFIANEISLSQSIEENIKKEIQEFYGFESIPSEGEWINRFEQSGFIPINVLEKQSITQSYSTPDFHYSDHIEPELYTLMEKHVDMTEKYAHILDFRVFICTK
ncbi:class I SAM-dependent methyltransferase [Lysinibacillus sp. 54212]|uniref:class I SAM-dependent methyltransferase n=1 Tax=Lysinibacillus sp. 54212 TaxID=3119829 RepID=UPI002FC6AE99